MEETCEVVTLANLRSPCERCDIHHAGLDKTNDVCKNCHDRAQYASIVEYLEAGYSLPRVSMKWALAHSYPFGRLYHADKRKKGECTFT